MVLHVAHPAKVNPQPVFQDRILELRQDLRVRLLQDVREHVQSSAVRHRDHHVLHAALGGVADDLVDDRHHQVEAFDREPRLARERPVQEALEGLHFGNAIEQFEAVDRIDRRPELPRFNGLPQPRAFVGDEHMAVVVTGGRAVDLTQPHNGLERIRGAGRGRARYDRRRQFLQRVSSQAVRLLSQRRVADRIVKAKRIELCRQVAKAADFSGQGEGGNAGLHVGRPTCAAGALHGGRLGLRSRFCWVAGRPSSERPAGRLVHRRGVTLVALEQLVDIPRIGPGKLVPRVHNLPTLTGPCPPAEAFGEGGRGGGQGRATTETKNDAKTNLRRCQFDLAVI